MSLHLRHIGKHVLWTPPDHATDRPILGVVVGTHSVLAVDAGNSSAHAVLFQEALLKSGIAKPDYVALTHWHWDHVFGAEAFEGLLIAQQRTTQMLEEMSRWKWSDAAIDARVEEGTEIEFSRDMIKAELTPVQRAKLKIRLPDITFTTHLEIDLGDLNCQLIHMGGDHSNDSTIIYIPEDRVAFLGDSTSGDPTDTPWYYTTRRINKLMDDLLALDAKYYFHSHIPEPITREGMEAMSAKFRKIGDLVVRTEGDKTAAHSELPQVLGRKPTQDDLELVDAFIAGLTK
jgi:glyoxylase-like metal-dependent hydrolase (beta-lactamase superfamily II)